MIQSIMQQSLDSQGQSHVWVTCLSCVPEQGGNTTWKVNVVAHAQVLVPSPKDSSDHGYEMLNYEGEVWTICTLIICAG